MLDLHCHILPGLDDGARNEDRAVEMARMAVKDGITGMVCTPHWVLGRWENDRETILAAVAALQERLTAEGIPLVLYPGAELRLDVSIPERLKAREIMTLADTGRYALIEFPEHHIPVGAGDFLWELIISGVTPVIGHPERNEALRKDPARLFEWVTMGALTQLTAASVCGLFGEETRAFSTLLLRHHVAHVLSTDAHGLRQRMPMLSRGLEVVTRIVGKDMARQMVLDTPELIVRNETITPPEPIPLHEAKPRTRGRRLFPFFAKGLILVLALAACDTLGTPTVKQVRPGQNDLYWDTQTSRWEYGVSPKASDYARPDNPVGIPSEQRYGQATEMSAAAPGPVTGVARAPATAVAAPGSAPAVQMVPVPPAPTVTTVPQGLKDARAVYQDYIREKFKGRRVVFPEDLPHSATRSLPAYVIGPDDELLTLVWQNPDLSVPVIVRSDGRVSLPLIGDVRAAGLTIPQFEAALRQRYSAFVEKPQVTVTPKAFNSLKVFITGAVRVPTVNVGIIPSGVPLRGDYRLLSTLATVEILPDADLVESYIVRRDLVIPVDLDRLLRDGDVTQNIVLEPADTVVIPTANKRVTVLGEVQKPGRFPVYRQTTVLDAIGVAGGLKRETADLNLAYVARQGRALPIDVKRLIDGGDLSQNALLLADDIVYVPNILENKITVLGEVKKPGVVRFQDPVDVLEAVTEAGDFLVSANRGQVVVVRGAGARQRVYALNTLKMMRGEGAREKFILERNDVVYVPRSFIGNWHVFFSQLLPAAQVAGAGSVVAP